MSAISLAGRLATRRRRSDRHAAKASRHERDLRRDHHSEERREE